MLEVLLSSTAIITDENDVGTFMPTTSIFKSVITNDIILLNHKGLKAIRTEVMSHDDSIQERKTGEALALSRGSTLPPGWS